MNVHVKLMRGLPGSGKSTYARENWPDAAVCSADHYFMLEGEYRFDRTKLGEAHRSCLNKFLVQLIWASQTAQDYPGWYGKSLTLVVDNTNTSQAEIEAYYKIAQAWPAQPPPRFLTSKASSLVDVEVVEVECDPETAWKRNTHGVPREAIDRMADRMRQPLPKWWNVRKVAR